jgi:hypothetical protein
MPDEQEFEVIDKRRVRAERQEPTDPAAESGQTPGGEAAGGTASSGSAEEASETRKGGITAEELRAAMEEASQAAGEEGGPMPKLDVPTALTFCIETLGNLAWIKMGLIPDPATSQIERDLVQAKVAIDAVGDLAERLRPLIGETQRRDLQVTLSNLRINFVQQSQRG